MPRFLLALTLAAGGLGLSAARAEKAPPPDRQPGQLDVFDDAKLFSPVGVQKAKEKLRETQFHHGLAVTVDTMTEPPANKKAAAEEAAASKSEAKWRAFMLDWARETAKADRAKGVYVLVTLKPVGGVAVIADRETTQRGFTEADDAKVREIVTAALREAKEKGKTEPEEAKLQEVRSTGLLKAVEYIANDLKDTRVADAGGDHRGGTKENPNPQRPAGSPIGGYICMGLFMLAGVWIVIALIRMFTGGGGGGPGGPGGGGGGFMSSLFGGLFGAAAGMWMYNHFFGGGGGMFGGGGAAYAGDAGAGGDAGGGDTGAGDWGGGSGDAGGFGGDFGGGGGDFGGGGGDFGGDF